MKLWRREREQPAVPDLELEDRIAQVLHRYGTGGSREGALFVYKSAARRRQLQQRGGARTHPQAEASQSRFLTTHAAAAPQPRADIIQTPGPIPEPVPSARSAEGPAAKTQDEWAYEHFVAFEKLCGNGDRIAERIEEARAYEPEQAPPEYLW